MTRTLVYYRKVFKFSLEGRLKGTTIRHIVTFQLTTNYPDTRRCHATDVRSRPEALKDAVPGVVSIEIHEDLDAVSSHWPLILASDFETAEALE